MIGAVALVILRELRVDRALRGLTALDELRQLARELGRMKRSSLSCSPQPSPRRSCRHPLRRGVRGTSFAIPHLCRRAPAFIRERVVAIGGDRRERPDVVIVGAPYRLEQIIREHRQGATRAARGIARDSLIIASSRLRSILPVALLHHGARECECGSEERERQTGDGREMPGRQRKSDNRP